MKTDLLYKVAITQIPQVGAVIAKNLIGYCGGVKQVFEAGKKELLKIPGVGPKIAESIAKANVLEEAGEELRFIEKHGIRPIFYTDPDYPRRLRPYHDAPVMLYYKGNADLNAPRTVGIIGTRKPTPLGKAICEELVEGLKSYGVTIVSGLAYGIDITAHKKSLESGIPTLGVLGHGLGHIYPAAHRKTAGEMCLNGGLITEYPSRTKPDRENFPMRNRIIAGLVDALIVVETARRGGSIITAEFANSYNKDVFAVPGRLRDTQSQGCNHLIKIHKAALIESAEDISYIMRWEALDEKKVVQQQMFADLCSDEEEIIRILKEEDHLGVDGLSYRLNTSPSKTASLLLNLEFKGFVKNLPGNQYMLI